MKSAARNQAGAFDLPSIITGVVVVALLTVGVLATVFGIIPFAQDNGARQDASAIRTAESVAKTKDGRYMSSAELVAAGYLSSSTFSAAAGTADEGGFVRAASVSKPTVDVNKDGSCYVAVVHSGTGALFHVTNSKPDPSELTPSTPQDCLDPLQMQTITTNAGGYAAKYIAATPANVKATVSGTTTATFSWDPVPTATGYRVETQTNGGSWSVLTENQPGTTATVTAARGSTVGARISTQNAAGTSAPTTPASVLLPLPSVSWTSQSSLGSAPNWAAANISTDGKKIAISKAGAIYTSTDSGTTWTTHAATDVAGIISTDGSKAMTVRSDGYVYDSYNFGATWAQDYWAGSRSWHIAGSADGNLRLMTCGDTVFRNGGSQDSAQSYGYVGAPCANALTMAPNGGPYGQVSVDTLFYTFGNPLGSGVSGWNRVAISGATSLSSLAFSSTMKYIVTADSNGYVFRSSDQGATWQKIDVLGKGTWSKVAISDDGTKMMAAANGGYLYSSIDSGKTWTQQTDMGTGTWTNVKIAGNGSNAIATRNSGPTFVGAMG